MNPIELDCQLCALLPPWYREVLDYQELCRVESAQLEGLAETITTVAANFFFQTMDEGAVSMWEQVLRIVPNLLTEDLEFRRFRVISRLTTRPPFTLGFLYQKLDQMIGPGEWSVDIDYPNYHMTIETPLQNTLYEGELIHLITTIKPAHIGWGIHYVDIKTEGIYGGFVSRKSLVEITRGIQTPRQGVETTYVGLYARRGGSWISVVKCSSFLSNNINVGLLNRQAEREVSKWDFQSLS